MSFAWDVTLVTYDKIPNLTPDDQLVADRLRSRGLRARAAVWDDRMDWSSSALAILRSTWDYFHKVNSFRGWLERVCGETQLVNDAALLRWNMDKRYLLDLELQGVAVVPSVFIPGGTSCCVAEIARSRAWGKVVVKPTVSGSAFGARLFDMTDAAEQAAEHMRSFGATRDMMIQPYQPEVQTLGERSLVFVNGSFTHSVRKGPFSAGAAGGESAEQDHTPDEAERAFAAHALKAAGVPTTYARVDIVPSATGLLLMELELIEPTLFFGRCPAAAEMFADAVLRLRERSGR